MVRTIEPWHAQAAPDSERGRLRGSALHTALRFLDLTALDEASEAEVARALRDLVEEGVLSEADYDLVEPQLEDLAAFYRSPLAGQIAAAAAAGRPLYREIPFSYAWPASRLFPERQFAADERVLIQGMIDLWFEDEGGELVLVDYKSDRVPADAEAAQRADARYARQLELYGHAIALATGRQVARRVIWSLPARRAIALD